MSTGVARGVSAVGSVLLAAGIAVLVNVWTTGWAWPVGVGVAAAVASQALLEFRRAASNNQARAGIAVDQRVDEVIDGDVTGVRGGDASAEIDVRQRVGRVDGGTIVGVDRGPDA